MATSSSASTQAWTPAAVAAIVLGGALAVAALIAAFVVADGAWHIVLLLVVGLAAMVTMLLLVLRPRHRRLDEATAVVSDLAALRFDRRMAVEDDEFASLATAMNSAAAGIGLLVGQLRQERSQLEALLNASSDATVAVDAAGVVVYLNDAARGLFASTGAAETGRPFIEVVRDHDLNDVLVAAAQKGERSVRVVPYGLSQRWIQATAVPIDGAGDWAALAVCHDLTEVRRLDSIRRDFISNVSHELRTPLAGIRAAAETLQEGAVDDRPAAIEFLGHIQRETDRLTQLVEELLELSRIESGAAPMSFAQLDAADLCQATVRRFGQQAERAGIRLRAEPPVGQVTVVGDAERLERALGNLVANAIKFTEAGGEVSVGTQIDGGDALISVLDTGIGIEPEQVDRVFERFYKADPGRGGGGIGLGLAIVKHIVHAHNGTVSVESRAGRGSTFTIRLPRL